MSKKEIDISCGLLETILRGEVLLPKHFDKSHSVDKYILEFCDWQDYQNEDEVDLPDTEGKNE